MKGGEYRLNGNISLAAPPVPRSEHFLRIRSWPQHLDTSPPSADASLRSEDAGHLFLPRFLLAIGFSPSLCVPAVFC